MHWFDTLAGQYSIPDRWVGLDYKELFLDRLLAEITYAHEINHAVLAMQSDFGQATNVIFKLQDSYTKLPDDTVDAVLWLLTNAQIDVQEGFATTTTQIITPGTQNSNVSVTRLPDEMLNK